MNTLKLNVKIYSVVTVIIYLFTNVTPLLAADAQPIQQDGSGQFVAVTNPDNQLYDRNFGAQLDQVPAVEKFEEAKPLTPVVDEEVKVRCHALIPQCGYDIMPEPVIVEKPVDSIQPLNPANAEDRANIFEAGQIFGTVPAYMSSEYQKDGSTKYSFYDSNKNLLGSKIVANQYIYDLRYYPQERLDVVSRDLNSSLTLDKTNVADVMIPPYEYKFHEAETWFAADGTKLDETNNEYLNAPQFVRDAAKNLARNLPSSLQVSVFTANDGSYGIRIDNIDSETAGKPGAFESIVIKFKSGNLESDGVKTLPEVESIQIQFTGRDLDQDATNALLDSARQLVRAGVADVLSGSSFLNQSGKNILDGETQAALVLVSQMNVGRIRHAEPGTLNFKIGELGFQVRYGADQETILKIKNPELQAVVDFIAKLQGQLKGYLFHVSKNEDGSYHVSVTGRDGLKYDYDAREPMYCVGWRCGGYQPARLDFDLKFEDGKLNLVDGSLKFQREQHYWSFYVVDSVYGTVEGTDASELIFRGLMRLGRESGLSGADQLASALAGLMRSTEPQQVDVGGVTHTLFSVDGQNYLLRSRKNLLSAEKITPERAQQLSALINFVRTAGYYLQPTATIRVTGINADGTYSVRIEKNKPAEAGDFSAMNFRVEFKNGAWELKTGSAAVVFSGFTLPAAGIQALIDSLRNPPAPAYQLHLAAMLGELAKIKIQSVNAATGITVFSRGGFDYELVRARVDGVFKYSVRIRIAQDMVDLGNGQWLKINPNHPLAQVILQKLKDGQVTWNYRYDSYGNFSFTHEGVVYTIGANSAYWVAPGYWYVSMVQATTAEGMMTYQYFNQDGSLYHTWKRFYKQYEDGSSLEQNFYADGAVSWERRVNKDGSSTEKSFAQDGRLTYQADHSADGNTYSRWFNEAGQITHDQWYMADGSYASTYYTYEEINGEQKLVRSVTNRRDASYRYSSEETRFKYDSQNRVVEIIALKNYTSATTGEMIYAFGYQVWDYELNQRTIYSSESNKVNFANEITDFSDAQTLINLADLKLTADYQNVFGEIGLKEIRFYVRGVDGNWNDKPYQIQRDGKNYAFIDDQLISMVDQEVMVDGKPAKVVWQTPYHTRLADGTFGLKKMALLLSSNDGSFSAEVPIGSTVSIGGVTYEIKINREDGKIQMLPLDSPSVAAVKSFVMQDLIKSFGITKLEELLAAGLIKIRIDLVNLSVLVEIDPSVKAPNETANLFDPLGSNLLPSQIQYTLGKSQPLMMGVPCSVSADGVTDCAREPDPIYFLKSAQFNVGDKIFKAKYLPELETETGVIRLEGPGDNRLYSVTITSVVDNCHGDVCTQQYLEVFLGQLKYEYAEDGAIKIFSGMEITGEGKYPLGKAIHLEPTDSGVYRVLKVEEFDNDGNLKVMSHFNYAPSLNICLEGTACPMVMPPLYQPGSLMQIKREDVIAGFLSEVVLDPFAMTFADPDARSAIIRLANGEEKRVTFHSLEQLLSEAKTLEEGIVIIDDVVPVSSPVVAHEEKSSAAILMEKIQRGEIAGYYETEDEEEKRKKQDAA